MFRIINNIHHLGYNISYNGEQDTNVIFSNLVRI